MNRYFLFLSTSFLLFIYPVTGRAQNYFYNSKYFEPVVVWETGLSAGGMNCLTDLGGNSGPGRYFIKDVNSNNTKFCGAIYIRALYNNIVGGRVECTVGKVMAYDSILKNDNSIAHYRYKRNLHFRSLIAELSVIGEWYFLSHLMQNKQNTIPSFSPYILTGVSIFHFNPEAKLNDRWVSLQPLHTEGQGFREYPNRNNYKRTQFNFSVGMGIRYELSALFNLQLELVHRILLTDYLDDVSTRYIDQSLYDHYLDTKNAGLAKQLADRRIQLNSNSPYLPDQQRGNASNKDAYFSINLKIGLVLNRERRL